MTLARYVRRLPEFIQKPTTMERTTYVKPAIELVEVAVESGFATSVDAGVEGFDREEWQ